MTRSAPVIVTDASIWVARLVPPDVFHASVKTWLTAQRAAGVEFVAPALLLTEVAGALSRRLASAALATRAVKQLEGLAGLRLVEMDASLLRRATQLAADLGLRGADAVYVAAAQHLNVPLMTLDIDQRDRAAKHVAVVDLG